MGPLSTRGKMCFSGGLEYKEVSGKVTTRSPEMEVRRGMDDEDGRYTISDGEYTAEISTLYNV